MSFQAPIAKIPQIGSGNPGTGSKSLPEGFTKTGWHFQRRFAHGDLRSPAISKIGRLAHQAVQRRTSLVRSIRQRVMAVTSPDRKAPCYGVNLGECHA